MTLSLLQPCLLLDASGLATRIGLWAENRWLAYREEEAPALEALSASTRAVLAEGGIPFSQVQGFLYVEGPGSVLGLRLAAMAIRAWQAEMPRPAWACGSLHLAAALAFTAGIKPPFSICTEARQGHWNVLTFTEKSAADLGACQIAELPPDQLPGGTLFYLQARKSWSGTPPHATRLPASLRDHPKALAFPGLCRAVETAIPHGSAPTYRKWEPSAAAR